MQWTPIALVVALGASGILLLRLGDYYFQNRNDAAKSMGAIAMLTGFAFLIAALASIWAVRIRHLFH
jgi:hypothetical protein